MTSPESLNALAMMLTAVILGVALGTIAWRWARGRDTTPRRHAWDCASRRAATMQIGCTCDRWRRSVR